MGGILQLERLLAEMQPTLTEGEYVFCSVPGARYGDLAWLAPLAAIREAEGLTLVLERDVAERAGLGDGQVFRAIVLGVHSDLSAVGLTAAVSQALAEAGISANLLAGYYHDQVLVPSAQAESALTALEALSARASGS